MNYFITGIGTNVGKTIVSAILTEALQTDYWKPIQSGTSEGLDSNTVKSLISNTKTIIHPESYLLKAPLSPHYAAKLENIEIELKKITLPVGLSEVEIPNKHLIIEGAGGLLVPINTKHYVIDIAKQFDCEIVLVISDYLGCINHTLLSIDYLLKNNFKIKTLVFNGTFDEEIKNTIINYAPQLKTIDIAKLAELSKHAVLEEANRVVL